MKCPLCQRDLKIVKMEIPKIIDRYPVFCVCCRFAFELKGNKGLFSSGILEYGFNPAYLKVCLLKTLQFLSFFDGCRFSDPFGGSCFMTFEEFREYQKLKNRKN